MNINIIPVGNFVEGYDNYPMLVITYQIHTHNYYTIVQRVGVN